MLKETKKVLIREQRETLSQLVFTIEQTKLIREIQRRIHEKRDWKQLFTALVVEFEIEADEEDENKKKKNKNSQAIKEWKLARLYRMIWMDEASASAYTSAVDIIQDNHLADALLQKINEEADRYGYVYTREY